MKGQIEKRGDGVYRLRWYRGRVGGKRLYGSETIHGTKRQAEQRLRAILSHQDQGHAVPSRTPTLFEFLETWKSGEAAARLRPRTLRSYVETLERHVVPKLGAVSLKAIHTARIESEVVAPLREKGRVRTAQLAVAALSKVLSSALKDPTFGLAGNPCRGVEVGASRSRRIAPLDADERARFREAIRGTPHEAFFLLLMGTGLRPGEARALGWEHIDLESGSVRVEQAADDRGEIFPPKTEKARRAVPVPPGVRQVLRELHLRRGRPKAGLVFPDRRGEVLDARNLLRRHFRPALERAKIDRAKSLRLYNLRHGYATAALEAGADIRTTADLMGHANTRLTMDVYQHVADDRKREAARWIGKRLFGE